MSKVGKSLRELVYEFQDIISFNDEIMRDKVSYTTLYRLTTYDDWFERERVLYLSMIEGEYHV